MAVVKLGVIGQQYALRSLAAGAQTAYNLYAEAIKDPNEVEKNRAFFYGRPGYHAFANTGGSAVRGIWTGAGRCFIAWDTHYAEFNSSGTQVGPTRNHIECDRLWSGKLARAILPERQPAIHCVGRHCIRG